MSKATPDPPPRMLGWVLLSVLLIGAALLAQEAMPGSVVAVTLYKAHLLALGGWGGYWLDRALFPYDRPHEYLAEHEPPGEPRAYAPTVPMSQLDHEGGNVGSERLDMQAEGIVSTTSAAFGHAMLRRAIVVAACLVCVGLGA